MGEEKLDTVGMPSIVDFNVDDAKVLTITFSTELYPEVTLGQYKGLEGVRTPRPRSRMRKSRRPWPTRASATPASSMLTAPCSRATA